MVMQTGTRSSNGSRAEEYRLLYVGLHRPDAEDEHAAEPKAESARGAHGRRERAAGVTDGTGEDVAGVDRRCIVRLQGA